MKTGPFSLFIAMTLVFSQASFAHNRLKPLPPCNHELIDVEDELSIVPDDDDDGLVTKRVEMSPDSLIEAYLRGIFPWDIVELTGPGFTRTSTAAWYSPPSRGILDFNTMKIPRSDRKYIRNALNSGQYTITIDQAFTTVMKKCAEQERWRAIKEIDEETGREKIVSHERAENWIKKPFLTEYPKLAKMGLAHSIEVWKKGEAEPVAGLYGVFVGGVFTGESMFNRDASSIKIALAYLVAHLKKSGHTWVDTQQRNALIKQWHGEEIDRDDVARQRNNLIRLRNGEELQHGKTFKQRLAESHGLNLPFPTNKVLNNNEVLSLLFELEEI